MSGDYGCRGMGDFYFIMFNFYIAFCVVGLFNVVTGVFVVLRHGTDQQAVVPTFVRDAFKEFWAWDSA